MKAIVLFIIVCMVTGSSLLRAQAPAIEWQKSLGGSSGDKAAYITQTKDGGYIVAGASDSRDGEVTGNHGNDDYWIVKLNDTGAIQWQRSLGGSDWDEVSSLQQTTDGGYILAGGSASKDGDVTGNHGGYDYWIVKLTSSGEIEWEKSIGGSDDESARSIQQTSDGGFIVGGYSKSNDGDVAGHHNTNYSSDYWIVKLNDTGAIEWQRSLGGSGFDDAYSIQQITNGGYIVAGGSNSNNGDATGNHGGSDYWVVALNDTGAIVSQRSLGGNREDRATSIQPTIDGGCVVAGWSNSTDGDVTKHYDSGFDYWIVKLNDTGAIQWQKLLGGNNGDEASSIKQTTDGGYIVAGYSNSTDGDVTGNHGSYDYWIVKLTDSGTVKWQRTLGGGGDDEAYSILQTTDGGYIVVGWSSSDDGDVTSNHGGYDYWVVKLAPDGTNGVMAAPAKNVEQATVNPNPASKEITIRYSIADGSPAKILLYDMGGKLCKSEDLFPGNSETRLDVSELASGMYVVGVVSASGRQSQLVEILH